jgi:hypothetical protein
MSNKPLTIVLSCKISEEADLLIRPAGARKGSKSRLVDEAIIRTYKSKETVVPTLPDNPTTT